LWSAAGAGWALAGLGGGLFLWAASWIVRQVHVIDLTARELLEVTADAAERSVEQFRPLAEATQRIASSLESLSADLERIGTDLLLSDEQRRIRRERSQKRLAEQLVGEAERALEIDDADAAQQAVDRLAEAVPDLPELPELAGKVASARSDGPKRRIERARREVEQLLAAGNIREAETVAEKLVVEEPDFPQAQSLLEHVHGEAEAQVARQRRAIYSRLEQLATDRRWSEALRVAQQLVAAYPESSEAQMVMVQMPTLEDNVRIQEARRLRDRIRGHIGRKEFAAARDLAEELLERFPHTAAAGELRRQLPKLEELSRGRDASSAQLPERPAGRETAV